MSFVGCQARPETTLLLYTVNRKGNSLHMRESYLFLSDGILYISNGNCIAHSFDTQVVTTAQLILRFMYAFFIKNRRGKLKRRGAGLIRIIYAYH